MVLSYFPMGGVLSFDVEPWRSCAMWMSIGERRRLILAASSAAPAWRCRCDSPRVGGDPLQASPRMRAGSIDWARQLVG